MHDVTEQLLSSAVDLVTVQSQWSAAKHRKGDSVAQYCQNLLVLESKKGLLGKFGHTLSDNEAIINFIEGPSDSLRNRHVLRRVKNPSFGKHW